MTSFGRFMSGIKFKAATLPQGDNNNIKKNKKNFLDGIQDNFSPDSKEC